MRKLKIKNWSTDATEALRECFSCTYCSVFMDTAEDLDKAADTSVTDYVLFCEEMIIPKRTLTIFPNNKPWITKKLKSLLNGKKRVFQTGNRK